ncbi:MAG: hypothetical protein O3B31_07110 [Chloroflexi bacterium]|nr:hypothetical protein [Chloroflexota bacterium]MDA1003103.1 hypothetical protein [Chloroflexota bacterium]
MNTARITLRTFRWVGALLGLAALMVIAVACSSSSTNTATPGPVTTTAAGATAAPPTAADVTVGIGDDAGGKHLVGPNGHALYLFANDATGLSNCSGGCAQNWPPLPVAAGTAPTAAEGVSGTLDAIDRVDGTRQVTLDGHPLYFFVGDTAAGQTTGDGVGRVWSLARTGAPSAAGAAPANATQATGIGY